MADFLSIDFRDNITPLLKGLPENVAKAIDDTVQLMADRLEDRIIDSTPADSGDAIAGWKQRKTEEGSREIFNDKPHINVLEYGGYPVVSTKRRTKASLVRARKKAAKKRATKKKRAAKKAKKVKKKSAKRKAKKRREAKRVGKRFKRGNALLGGFEPGLRTQRAPGGTPKMRSNVSRQARSGMVRNQLQKIRPEFKFELGEALDLAFAGQA